MNTNPKTDQSPTTMNCPNCCARIESTAGICHYCESEKLKHHDQKPNGFHHWQGKRILITWTDDAYARGADWPSFVVVQEAEHGLFLRGCDAPDGTKHDGSLCFARHDEIRDIWEWKPERNNNIINV